MTQPWWEERHLNNISGGGCIKRRSFSSRKLCMLKWSVALTLLMYYHRIYFKWIENRGITEYQDGVPLTLIDDYCDVTGSRTEIMREKWTINSDLMFQVSCYRKHNVKGAMWRAYRTEAGFAVRIWPSLDSFPLRGKQRRFCSSSWPVLCCPLSLVVCREVLLHRLAEWENSLQTTKDIALPST